MANITAEIEQIKTAVYGEEVRKSFIDAFSKINDESEETVDKVDEAIEQMGLTSAYYEAGDTIAFVEPMIGGYFHKVGNDAIFSFYFETPKSLKNVKSLTTDNSKTFQKVMFLKPNKTLSLVEGSKYMLSILRIELSIENEHHFAANIFTNIGDAMSSSDVQAYPAFGLGGFSVVCS